MTPPLGRRRFLTATDTASAARAHSGAGSAHAAAGAGPAAAAPLTGACVGEGGPGEQMAGGVAAHKSRALVAELAKCRPASPAAAEPGGRLRPPPGSARGICPPPRKASAGVVEPDALHRPRRR